MTETVPVPRDAVLAAVRAALADVSDVASADTRPPPASAATPSDRAALLADFAREARAVGTVVHVVATVADAGAAVATIFADARVARAVAWPTPLARAVAVSAADGSRDGLDVRFAGTDADAAAIAHADAGITEADALVAASGTLLLRAASGARTVSLLPPLHVAVVPAARVVADLGAALPASRGRDGAPDTCVTLVTGPSRTADIEKKLVVGVHGPCALHVIVVEEADC
ncbi:MAG TPA: LUD domain-containing protein [Candidatus Binatia bacterium]